MVDRGHHIRCAKPKRAFTLVELLVVIVVILLLASMATPFMGAAIEQARQVDCRGRLRNLHTAAASHASENQTLVPLVHKGDFSSAGEILKSGGEFVGKYMDQSWEVSDKSYANMLSDDNVFQCPSALDNWDYHPKKTSTNYRLTGFALDLGGSWNSSRPSELPALYPSMMAIGGTVQDSRGKHPAGRVCMAMDWMRSGSDLLRLERFARSGRTRTGHVRRALDLRDLAMKQERGYQLCGVAVGRWVGAGVVAESPS